MGFFKNFFDEVVHFERYMPTKVEIYSDDDVEAFEIEQPPNPYVPERVQYFHNKKNNVLRFSAGKPKRQIEAKNERRIQKITDQQEGQWG